MLLAYFNRLFASDLCGVIHLWDRRASDLPFLELTTNSRTTLNSIQLIEENQVNYYATFCFVWVECFTVNFLEGCTFWFVS